ncbi:reverse transcriptase domain-containing protein [Tanacetum coccineum]|uniref:Reverse transcriptase domain-containing protein n=1 Tax=Tanacetum coccineum TaxID=301880 RepID=A0ABQ4WSS5_9ASTR
MRTRSQARKRRQQQVRQTSVETPNLEKPNNNQELFNPPTVTMADNRTMAQLLEAPTEGYEDAIVVPEITANNFEIKHGLLNLVQNKQFFGHDKEDPHAHIRYFNKITSTMKFPNVPKLHQLDTFYNSLNSNDQDSLNSAAGGNFLDKMPRECLKIIESKSKVRQSRSKAIVSKVSTSSSTPAVSSDVAELKDMVRALILDKKNQTPAPAPVKAVEQSCVTCGGGHSYQNCPATDGNIYRDNIQEYVSQAAAVNYNQGNASYRRLQMINQPPTFQAPVPPAPVNTASLLRVGSLPSNTIANPKGHVKAITTRSGVSYNGPQISSSPKEKENEPEVTKDTVQPTHDNIQPPVRLKLMGQLGDFSESPFRAKFADASLHLPKICTNVLESSSMTRFLIPCDFPKMNECLALADLGASISLMPLTIWKETSLPALWTKTLMILELADPNYFSSHFIAEDVFVKVGTFFFPADFVVVDYVADPRVPLILGRPFLRTARALIDVHGEQMTLRHDDQSVTFKVGDTKTFSYNIIESVNRVDVIDIACEEYVQEVLEISESGNPTSTSDLMIDSRSPSFTPFGGSDFLMEEIDEFLEHDDSIPPGVDGIYDSEGDTVYLEELLSVINSDPNLPPSPVCEINVPEEIKSSCEDPPDLELKDLPSHLEYAFLEGDDKLPVIIAKNLKDEDKTALIKTEIVRANFGAGRWKGESLIEAVRTKVVEAGWNALIEMWFKGLWLGLYERRKLAKSGDQPWGYRDHRGFDTGCWYWVEVGRGPGWTVGAFGSCTLHLNCSV